ncbi:MAG: nucleotidyl transferase AbiEii/AbiGii toxin family protein [Planctomycetota bacterium]
MRDNANIRNLRRVARALGDMREQVVFVGGAVLALYATDPAAPQARPTFDVDCVIRVTSRGEYRQVEKRLEDRGFQHDTSQDVPLCRWLYGGLKVDVMPTDEDTLGFANRWHAAGTEHTVRHQIDDRTEISILPAPFFVASKLEALHSRGGQDWRGEPDLEDVVFVLDNRPELPSEVRDSAECVLSYLTDQFARLSQNPTTREYVASALPPAAGSARVEYIIGQMRQIADAGGA